jgi:hypothetical protein
MKKLLMLVVTLMLGASLAMAQAPSGSSGSTDKPAATKTAKKSTKKAPAKKDKAAKSSTKKADSSK